MRCTHLPGTEFAPSGWNTRNGEFTWHPTNFPDPPKILEALHAEHFKVVVHVVIEGRRLTGTVEDPCTAPALPSGRTPDNRWPPDRQVACYWPFHKPVMDAGVDGWFTGMPILRALWLHYRDDVAAVARGDDYLWGPDLLVAPVVEKGATSRRLYLPGGAWFDFWTEERIDGGREIDCAVDLATVPL